MIEVPVEVKEALKDGRLRKEYFIDVYDDNNQVDFTIDNDHLVAESVSIDERLDSGDLIKFGLCEGASLEFQYFGLDNITGRRVFVTISIQYTDEDWYDIPMGYFTVEKCSRQASTGILKVTAYNKLQSKYLDAKANQLLADAYSVDYTLSLYDILRTLLGDYQIEAERVPYDPAHPGPVPFPSTIPSNNITIGSFRFTKTYGPETPLNAYNAGVSANQQFNIIFNANAPRYSIQPGPNVEIDVIAGTMEGFERSIEKYIKDLFDNSDIELVGSSGSVGHAVISAICNNGGFYRLCGITLTEQTGWDAEITHYSTIDYEHGVAGVRPIKDIIYRAIGKPNYSYYIELNHPATLYLKPYDGAFIFFTGRIYDPYGTHATDNLYNYYDENNVLQEAEWYPAKFSNGEDYLDDINSIQLYEVALSPAEKLTFKISDMPEFTLRDIASGIYETLCQYGQLNRITDLFGGVELNHYRLYPAEDLYPNNSLYPGGSAMSSEKSSYSQLWADEGNIRKWRYLIITYKGRDSSQQETELTLQRTINEDGTDDYLMTDNWLFNNMIWTDADVGAYADRMVPKLQDITWFPFEMWLPGLPYLETGDEIEVTVNDSTYTTYILQRQLKGIQNLQDTYINGALDIF